MHKLLSNRKPDVFTNYTDLETFRFPCRALTKQSEVKQKENVMRTRLNGYALDISIQSEINLVI
jgi:hypothetical protein